MSGRAPPAERRVGGAHLHGIQAAQAARGAARLPLVGGGGLCAGEGRAVAVLMSRSRMRTEQGCPSSALHHPAQRECDSPPARRAGWQQRRWAAPECCPGGGGGGHRRRRLQRENGEGRVGEWISAGQAASAASAGGRRGSWEGGGQGGRRAGVGGVAACGLRFGIVRGLERSEGLLHSEGARSSLEAHPGRPAGHPWSSGRC